MDRVVALEPLCFRADVGAVNRDDRTVEVTFSTGAAVERVDYWTGKRYIEKLSLDPAHIRLERFNAGAPVLDAHSGWSIGDQIGVVVENSVKLSRNAARVLLRFSKREAVTPIWNDIEDRIYRNVSVGYKVRKFLEELGKGQEIPTRTAIDWEPHEVSLVPMPADIGAQVRKDPSLGSRCLIVSGAHAARDVDRVRLLTLARASSF